MFWNKRTRLVAHRAKRVARPRGPRRFRHTRHPVGRILPYEPEPAMQILHLSVPAFVSRPAPSPGPSHVADIGEIPSFDGRGERSEEFERAFRGQMERW